MIDNVANCTELKPEQIVLFDESLEYHVGVKCCEREDKKRIRGEFSRIIFYRNIMALIPELSERPIEFGCPICKKRYVLTDAMMENLESYRNIKQDLEAELELE